jgi:tol-pal system protein YbgF
MMNKTRSCKLLFITLLVSSSASIAADSALASMSVKQRLERVERLLSSDVLMEQSQQNEMLRTEITALRELIEQQQYEMETIKQRQRSLYLDMDRRLTHLETGAARVSRSPVPPPGSGMPAVPVAVTPGLTATTTAASAGARQAYGSAFELLKEGRYASSITAFEDFLKRYPGSQYVDNAQYWLAEANYVSREYKVALKEFQNLIAGHPDSTKIPGARLKIGYVYYELKNWPAAKQALAEVVKLYPDTTVAKKANERLARMKREGR